MRIEICMIFAIDNAIKILPHNKESVRSSVCWLVSCLFFNRKNERRKVKLVENPPEDASLVCLISIILITGYGGTNRSTDRPTLI